LHGAGSICFHGKSERQSANEAESEVPIMVRLVRDVNGTTGVNDDQSENLEMPNEFQLQQNYPNPFNPTTTIRFSLPKNNLTTLKIYNSAGQLVSTLVNKQLSAGTHEFQWQAANMPSGIYYYYLKSGAFSEAKKMVLLK